MKNTLIALLAVIFFAITVQAQDGIYGSFMVGYKNIDMIPLDDALNKTGMYRDNIEFGNQYLTLGGEGHIILAKHLTIGGKAIGTFRNLEVDFIPDAADTNTTEVNDIKITTGMAVGTIGFAFLAGEEKQLRIIPHVGIGASTFLFQKKGRLPEGTVDFDDLHTDDQMVTIQKAQLPGQLPVEPSVL